MSDDFSTQARGAWLWTLTALASAVLVACGGGGGSAEPAAASPSSTVSGAVVKGPVAGATVCAYALLPTGKGTSLGCTTSTGEGNYSLTLAHAGDIVVEATGGTYVDEATGAKNVLLSAPLTVVGSAGPDGTRLYATPLTAMAFNQAVAGGGLTVAAFESAATQVGSAFGVPASMPLARTLPAVTGATNAYGDALIAVSGLISASLTLNNFVNSKPVSTGTGNAPGCSPAIKVAEVAPPLAGGVYLLDDGSAASKGLLFDVTDPLPAWRALLPASGAAMGCDVTVNTAAAVTLRCELPALQAGLRFVQDAATDPLPAALPAQGVLLAGRRIEGRGDLALSGVPITLPALALGGGAVTPPLTINSGSGGIKTGTDISVVGGTISSGGGNILTTVPIGTATAGMGSPGQTGSISITTANACNKAG